MRHRVALLVLATIATTARAQTIDIHLREEGSATPIAGAVVRLLRDTTSVAQSLSNAGGRAVLHAPAPGVYRIRINRIGYAPVLTDTVSLAADQVLTKEIVMGALAVALPGLAVQTKSECGGPVANGALAGAIWEQVRTALAANVLTERVWAIPLYVKTFHRDLSLEGDSLSEVVTGAYVAHGPPFASPDPAGLVTKGYAYLVGDVMTFGAPDAALLLTDVFAQTHCFRAVAGPIDDIVGLAFEPTPRRRLSDVRGTLWVNRRTSELQLLEYAYTNLPPELADLGLRGRIDFRRLPTGAWIVSYWMIRMPRMGGNQAALGRVTMRDAKQRLETHAVGYVEDGGHVTVDASFARASAFITGRIFDSTTGSPVADAVIRVQGDTAFATSELDGRFMLATTRGGTRTVVVTHPKLGLIDDGSTRTVNLSIGDSAIVNVSVPPAARMARDFCGPATNRSGLVGLTWADGAVTEDLEVQVTWESRPGVAEEERAQSGPRGVYVFCDLPASQALTVRLRRGTTVLAEQKITLSLDEFHWVELVAGK